jgi:hypothetical protein
MALKGMDRVNKNLNTAIQGIKRRSLAGLIDASITVRRDMDRTPPLIPIGRTGNLRGSWFTSPMKTIHGSALTMGFSANYAIMVHEMVDRKNRKINWSRPGSGPKFYEKALDRNHAVMLKDIQNQARIK